MKNIFNFSGCYCFEDTLFSKKMAANAMEQSMLITFSYLLYKFPYIKRSLSNAQFKDYDIREESYETEIYDEKRIVHEFESLKKSIAQYTTVNEFINLALHLSASYKFPHIPKKSDATNTSDLQNIFKDIISSEYLYSKEYVREFDDDKFIISLKNFLSIRYHCLFGKKYEVKSNTLKSVLLKYLKKDLREKESQRFDNNKKVYAKIFKKSKDGNLIKKANFYADDSFFVDKQSSIFDYLIISLRHLNPYLYLCAKELAWDNNKEKKKSNVAAKRLISALNLSPLNIYNDDIIPNESDPMDKYAIDYITERLLNVNLMNKIYNTPLTELHNAIYNILAPKSPLYYLASYPLLDFRLDLVDSKDIFANRVYIISHHIFVYFPLICKILDFLIVLYNRVSSGKTLINEGIISEDYPKLFDGIKPLHPFPSNFLKEPKSNGNFSYTNTYFYMQKLYDSIILECNEKKDLADYLNKHIPFSNYVFDTPELEALKRKYDKEIEDLSQKYILKYCHIISKKADCK